MLPQGWETQALIQTKILAMEVGSTVIPYVYTIRSSFILLAGSYQLDTEGEYIHFYHCSTPSQSGFLIIVEAAAGA